MKLPKWTLGILISVTCCAWAGGIPYIGGSAGVDFADEVGRHVWLRGRDYHLTRRPAPVAGVSLGYEWEAGWRVEGEAQARRVKRRLEGSSSVPQRDVISCTTWVPAAAINVGANLPRLWCARPYVLVGGGVTVISEQMSEPGYPHTVTRARGVYQMAFGIEYPLGRECLVGLRYRLIQAWHAGLGHSAELTLRKKFG